MPNVRVQITLDQTTRDRLAAIAKRQDRAESIIAAELSQKTLELYEDIKLAEISDECLQKTARWIPHEDAWAEQAQSSQA